MNRSTSDPTTAARLGETEQQAEPDVPTRPQRPRRQAQDGEDFTIAVAPPRPLIAPGVYEAKSTYARLKRLRLWDRSYLEIGFMIFDGEYMNGAVLAHGVQGFFAVGDGKAAPGPSSKLARLSQLLDPGAKEIRAEALKNKLFRVEVVTVSQDRYGRELPEPNRYSKVANILERLA